MLVVLLRFNVPPKDRNEVLRTGRLISGVTRVRAGCINCFFGQDAENENAFTIIEEWESQKDLNAHILGDEFRKVIAVMEMSTQAPEFKMMKVTEVSGIEAVKKIKEAS